MTFRDEAEILLKDLYPNPFAGYNRGLLPDEEAYNPVIEEALYTYEEQVSDALNSLVELHEKYEKETMERFGIKKGVEYRIHASDKAIVLENMKYLKLDSIRKKAGLDE